VATGRKAVTGKQQRSGGPLVAALRAAGTAQYLPHLLDAIGELVTHDRITVTRYVADREPEFVAWRNFSMAQVDRYLTIYHAFDPFQKHWSEIRRPGVVPLAQFGRGMLAGGRYVTEFLRQAAIDDEVGVLLPDGDGSTLGVFLERSGRTFSRPDVARLTLSFPLLAALHDTHRRLKALSDLPDSRLAIGSGAGEPAETLTPREHAVLLLMLAGHPTATIARRLGLSTGTVRNHRSHIYAKLDVTSERELLLRYATAS
jgi:DNA-binding CsgD family transcriptional regulator